MKLISGLNPQGVIRLTPVPSGPPVIPASISGTVVDDVTGEPVGGVWVFWANDYVQTNMDGTYRMDNLPIGVEGKITYEKVGYYTREVG